MSIKKLYKLEIASKYIGEKIQTWTWSGQMKSGFRVIHNFSDYATDTYLLLDEKNNVVGGYCYLFNQDTTIDVTELGEVT